ncbi:MAG: C10 family peptidase [Sedimentisphaerales bacterium]|nr:C10 family peptidase [Sedimentisphaerales bacterium]
MKNRSIVSTIITASILLFSVLNDWQGSLSAKPTTSYEAQKVVTGWLRADSKPLDTNIGTAVSKVETFFDNAGEVSYYVIYIEPSGFVIVSANDSIEPVIGFAGDGTFEQSPDSPLWILVNNDLNIRNAEAQADSKWQASVQNSDSSKARSKWSYFLSLADSAENGLGLMGLSCLSDIRVTPFIRSQWGQTTACGENCFNYYTPENYSCGCLATTIAQVMRYYEYPVEGIGRHQFTIFVDGAEQMRTTRGQDGSGGPYNWDDMVLRPNLSCETLTETQRQAIGALCYDIGLACNMQYSLNGSAAQLSTAVIEMTNTFMYGNAVLGYNLANDVNEVINNMINVNLDAKAPVVLGITEGANLNLGHAVLCDGYGYNSSTLYHHLNMGWYGTDDVWYNLPNVNPDSTDTEYHLINACIYNIFVSGTGEIISGRVFGAEDTPLANAKVYARTGSQNPVIASTDHRGIYAFKGLSSNSSYRIWVEKDGFIYPARNIATGKSRNGYGNSGNCWGIDFYPAIIFDPASFSTFYVDDDAAADPEPGDPAVSDPDEDGSYEHPFDAIQEAIDIAATGDTVVVLSGTYTDQGNRDLDFKGKAITLRSTDPNDPVIVADTIIDCQASESEPHRGFIFQNYESSQSVLAGLTVTGGYSRLGGGIYCGQCAAPTVINCIFRENNAYLGGGFYSENARPSLSGCTFSDNRADAGGAMYIFADEDVSDPVLDKCFFSGNAAVYNGGAIYNSGQVEPIFTSCVFTENESSGGGGAIRNNSQADPNLFNCIFNRNHAETYGGAIRNSNYSNTTLTNCTFYDNSASNGNSLACTSDNDTALALSTFKIVNCIIRDHGDEIWDGELSVISVRYSNVPNSSGTSPRPGEGNIFTEPYFADADNGDFHLMSRGGRYDPNSQTWIIDDITSPCIDAGDPGSPIGSEPSPNGGRINMGAYGGTAEAGKSFIGPDL